LKIGTHGNQETEIILPDFCCNIELMTTELKIISSIQKKSYLFMLENSISQKTKLKTYRRGKPCAHRQMIIPTEMNEI
jgi:hypothetical protein